MRPRSYDLIMVMPHMGPGGSQKVASHLLNQWARRGKRLCLVTLHDEPSDAHTVDSTIDRIRILRPYSAHLQASWWGCNSFLKSGWVEFKCCLKSVIYGATFAAMNLLLRATVRNTTIPDRILVKLYRNAFILISRKTSQRIRDLRLLFKETNPKIVLSFLGATNLQTIIAGFGNVEKIVISERNDPAMQKLAFPWEQLRNRLYRLADVVTANSRGAIDTMRAYVPSDKLIYIPNPVKLPGSCEGDDHRRNMILTVGRLVNQKGLDVLIEAFAIIADQIPDWRLEVVGDGPLRSMLEQLADTRGVGQKIIFHGYQGDVYDYYCKASIFALPSRYEGTPNVLIEAMYCGLPVVVSNSSPGILELVSHGRNGLVFPSEDVPALAESLLALATNQQTRRRMGLASREESRRFDLESVIQKWQDVLYGA